MPKPLYDGWCQITAKAVSAGRKLHLISEIGGARPKVHAHLVKTVRSHYEDPKLLADRIKRRGFAKSSKLLEKLLPRTAQARSGHVGEILATEAVSAILPDFLVPIHRLRWLDGREAALRGEDVIAVARQGKRVRFLKGESKSRATLSPAVVAEARKALRANNGRPSQHAMAFVMRRLAEMKQNELHLIFEDTLLTPPAAADLVHLLFGFSGNDASIALQADLNDYGGRIEQHSVNLRIPDHQAFIASIY